MKKVKNQKYLYRRDEIYYFRIVIPVKYRPYFDNKVQTKKSLGTANLRAAILGASEMLIRHELKMEVINQGKLTTDSLPKVPTTEELERISRKWLKALDSWDNIKRELLDKSEKEVLEG